MKRFAFAFSLLINLPVKNSSAQQSASEDYVVRFSSGGVNDDLSQGFVPSILQDHRGFMWFATKDGLNRYDGYGFVVYRHDADDPASISDNFADEIFEDSRGYLWVSAVTGGLNVYDPVSETFSKLIAGDRTNDKLHYGFIAAEDAAGNIWIRSREKYFLITVATKDNANGTVFTDRYHYSIRAAADVLKKEYHLNCDPLMLTVDYEGTLWFTHRDSLYEIRKAVQAGQKDIRQYSQSAFSGFPDCKIVRILSDSVHHHLFFVTTSGLEIYNTTLHQIERTALYNLPPVDNQHGYAIDADGDLWISNEECLFYDAKLNHFRKVIPFNAETNGPLIGQFKSLLFDHSGILWVGTNGYGVFQFNPRVEKFHKLANVPGIVGGIRGIKGDRSGRVLVYSAQSNELLNIEKGTIDKVMFTGGIFSVFVKDHTASAPVTFVQDSSGIFWFDYGFHYLARYDEKNNSIKFFHGDVSDKDPITFLWLDRKQAPWMLVEDTNSHVFITRFDPQMETFGELIPFPDKIIAHPYPFMSDVAVSSSGEFWIASVQGLYNYNPATKKWNHFANIPSNKNSLSNDIIFSLHLDESGPAKYLWIGTSSGGLNRFDLATHAFTRYSDKDGLPNNVIYGILADNSGKLWLSTNKGLCRFNPKTGDCTNYYVSDGLQGNEFNRYAYYKSPSGELFFGGVNGLNYFYPDEIGGHAAPPPIVFSDFRLFNKSVSPSSGKSPVDAPIDFVKDITLPYDQNMITFEFEALDYTAPEKNRYKYKLDGFDDDWISSGTLHSATYTNLDAGKYTFTVKAANSEGVWNETGRTINIIITPPWWQRWWAITLFVLAGVGVLLIFFRARTASLRKNQKNLEKKVEERTKELNESLANLRQTQNQLVQHEKLAGLGQLTAGIAHEIRNPLNFVNNFSELSTELIAEIKNANTDEERNDILADLQINLDKIRQHGKRADSIVKNMLDHARTSSGEKQLTDVNQLCDEFLELAYHGRRASIRDFNCRLERNFDPDLSQVNMVTQDISRVLLNLYNNAFDAVHEKTLHGIRTKPKLADGPIQNNYDPAVSVTTQELDHSVIIKVKDNGNGIPTSIKDKIFEPFFTTKSTGQGTGLGLSISYDIVKAHGGEMKVESKENEFTEFTIVLPE